MEDAIRRFHTYREIFKTTGIRHHFSLPRQHSISHPSIWRPKWTLFIDHRIKAVKEPWRRPSKFNALGQMLCTNTRLDQLAAACADFTERGMLDGTCASSYTTYFGIFSCFLAHTVIYSSNIEQLTCPDCNDDCDDTMDAGMDAMDEDEDEDDVRVAEGDDDDNDNGVVEGPVANCDVKLACTIGKCYHFNFSWDS